MNQIECKSCGHNFSGNYCPNCGEKVITQEDKSVKRWLGSALADLYMVDGKLLLTLKEILFFPARYAFNYNQGRRVKYLKPLNLFLLANLIYFLSTGSETFKTSLSTQMNGLPYSHIAKSMVEKKVEKEGISLYEYQLRYDPKTNEISKVILITLVPLLGLVFYLAFQRTGLMLSEGFNLAFQFWSFFILFFLLLLTGSGWLILQLTDLNIFSNDDLLSLIILGLLTVYLFFMMRQWRGKHWVVYGFNILLITASLVPIVFIYRAILLVVTLWLA